MDIKIMFLSGVIGYLSTGLQALKEKFAATGEADEQVKGAAVIFILYEDELIAVAKGTENTIDDTLFAELGEFCREILPPTLVAELENLRAKAPEISA
jgi:hypothetical protein